MFFKFSDVVDNVIQLSRQKIKKLGRSRRAIPRFVKRHFFWKIRIFFLKTISKLFFRFVNFTSNSEDLCTVFKDVEKLFRHPGYVLQQCAYINNLTHFRSAHLYVFKFLKVSKCRKQNTKFSHPPKNQRNSVHFFALASKSGWIKKWKALYCVK